jgi:hypothetical protein
VSLRSAQTRNLGLAALLLTGTVFSTAAHAQSAIFNYTAPDASGSHQYGLLNGNHVALYINDRGDLGAPYPIVNGSSVAKPSSIVNPATGQPTNVNANGSIFGNTAYGALFSQNPTGGLATIGDSVRAKSEFLGAGSTSIIEGFSVFANDGLDLGTRFVRNSDMNVNSFSVNGNSALGPLSASSSVSADLLFGNGNGGTLTIRQNVEFQDGLPASNRVRFTSTFVNDSADPLNGFRYARVVDANTAFTLPTTAQQFRTDADPNAFALTSINGSNAIGLGVFGSGQPGPPEPGSILFVANSALGEAALLQTPFDQANFYVELGTGNAASIKQKVGGDLDTSNDTVILSTLDFTTDQNFNDQVESVLGFGNTSDSSLILLSPSFDIAAGGTADFTFYYFFGQGTPSQVPEPGTVALLVAGGMSGLWLRRRRK